MRTRKTTLAAGFVVTSLAAGALLTGVVAPPSRTRPVVEATTVRLGRAPVEPGWSTEVGTGGPAQMVGVDWQGRVGGAVELRGLERGRWTSWIRVEGNPDEGPGRWSRESRGRTAAGPVWMGSAVRRVQVRVAEGTLARPRLHAVRTADLPATPLGAAAAGAAPDSPGIVNRAQWGADERWRNCGPDYADTVRHAVVHHTDNSNGYRRDQAAAMVRGIYFFHTRVNGWCDIGYNFLVDRFGQVFEGRAGGLNRAVIGSHSGGFNEQSTGVALIGDFQSAGVPSAMYSAVRRLLAWKLAVHGIDAAGHVTVTPEAFSGSRHPAGAPVSLPAISGHRDLDATACPGDAGYELLGRLRADVARDIGVSGGDDGRSGLERLLDDVTKLLPPLPPVLPAS